MPTPPPPAAKEHTRWSPGLMGFYLSCAGVSLGAAIGFGAHWFFRSGAGLAFGVALSGVSCVTCYVSLKAARRPPAAGSGARQQP
ncbi:MAG: hypothetical protein ACK6D1_11575, partial [Planctomycetota bacterium]